MIERNIKDVTDVAGLAAQARAGQIAVLLDDDGKPAAFLASGRCSRAELTTALLATRPECPGEVRMGRVELGRHWSLAIQKVRERNVVVVVEGRVLAGIIADAGPAGTGAIKLGNNAGNERNRAIVAGREVQIRRRKQVVARIIPPSRIAEFLPGWTLPEPEPLPKKKASTEERRRRIVAAAELRERRRGPRRHEEDDAIAPMPATVDDALGE